MDERLTFYNRNIETIIEKVKVSNQINKQNKEAILDFHESILTEITKKGITRKDGTRFKLIQDAYSLGIMLGMDQTFTGLNKSEKQFDEFLKKIRSKKEWNSNSQAQRCRSLVCLLKTVFPKTPGWLLTKRLGKVGFTPPLENEILSPEEMLSLIEAGSSPKTRAILSVLREGLRGAELQRLNVEDISFDGEGRAIICVRGGKTGFRNIPSRRGYVYLKAWMNAHPKPEAGIPLFPNTNMRRLTNAYVVKVNLQSFAKAKIPIVRERKLYNWRKSSITWFLRNGGSLIQASKIFGTSVQMIEATYGSVSQEELNMAVDAQAGIEPVQKILPKPDLSIKCARCSNENASFEKECRACGWNLSQSNPVLDMSRQMEMMREEMRIMNELVKRKIDPEKEDLPIETVKDILGIRGSVSMK